MKKKEYLTILSVISAIAVDMHHVIDEALKCVEKEL